MGTTRTPYKWGIVVAAMVVAGLLLIRGRIALSVAQSVAPYSAPFPVGMNEEARFEGSASCNGRACHNRPTDGPEGHEMIVWLDKDPHAQAYGVLLNDQSRKIMANLGMRQPAHETKLCLDCHTLNPPETARGEKFAVDEGVSCEACHGAAQRWLQAHLSAEWRHQSAAVKSRAGLTDLTSAHNRAQICASCHIGSAEKEVNHDLIAAGHPHLTFEMAAFQANLPKHWNIRRENQREPGLEARLWLVGQVVAASTQAKLLAQRARHSAVWPEFAEYDCFACHHDLQHQGWRQNQLAAGRAGSFPWATWNLSMTDALTRVVGGPDPAPARQALDELSRIMDHPAPDRARVALSADAAASALHAWAKQLDRLDSSPDTVALLLRLTANLDPKPAARHWSGAFQRYLALNALYKTLARMHNDTDPVLAALLEQYYQKLLFPPKTDSPRDYTGDKVEALLLQIRQHVNSTLP